MIKKDPKGDTDSLLEDVRNDYRAFPEMGIKRCLQCGLCTSNCPAARHSDYDPREMVKMVRDNNLEIMNNPDIWNCFYCYTCGSNCPANNSPCIVNQILRQKILLKGENNARIYEFLAYGYSYLDFGVGSIPSDFFDGLVADFGQMYVELKLNLEDIRQDLGLEDYNLKGEALEEVKSILSSSGFTSRLEEFKRCHES